MDGIDKARLKRRAFALPLAVGLGIFCVLGLAAAPMFAAAPKNVPMAVVNSDQGATSPTGESMNAGELVAQKLTGGSGLSGSGDGSTEAPVAWTQVDDEAELEAALKRGDYYGAVVIPADFTQSQVNARAALAQALQEGLSKIPSTSNSPESTVEGASPQALSASAVQGLVASVVQAQQSAGEPRVRVILNPAKSPMLAQSMQQTLTTSLARSGIQVDVETVGEPISSTSPLGPMMGVQFMVMPLFIMSLIMGIAVVVLRWPRLGTRAEKLREALVQLGYCMVSSLWVAVLAFGIVAGIGGVAVGASAIFLLWLASFCIMAAAIGLSDIAIPLGAAVMVSVFALGMSTAVLPVHMLPAFWADWVVPWAPQSFIGDGLRHIIYLHEGPFSTNVAPLAAWACAGVAAAVAAITLPSRGKAVDQGEPIVTGIEA